MAIEEVLGRPTAMKKTRDSFIGSMEAEQPDEQMRNRKALVHYQTDGHMWIVVFLGI